MDAQFIGAAMEGACGRDVSERVETYAIGLAIAEEIGRPLAEYRIVNHGRRARAYRFSIGDDVVELHRPGQPVRMIGSRVEDYVWVMIEPSVGPTAKLWVNLAGGFDDLATDYPNARHERQVYFTDIPLHIDTAIRDLVALRQEIAA